MEIGLVMNHSLPYPMVVHLYGAILFGIEWVAQIPMEMDILIPEMRDLEKV